MNNRRSVLDRADLYCPAPAISGRASYGGVPRQVYAAVGISMAIAFVLAAGVYAIIGWMFGEWWETLFVITPVIVGAAVAMFTVLQSRKRRDFIEVLRSSYNFD